MKDRYVPSPESAGLGSRRLAQAALDAVIRRRQPLDESLKALLRAPPHAALSDADRGLARAMVTACLRHLVRLRALLAARLRLGLPEKAGGFETLMLLGLTQLLYLDVPDHAAVDTTIRLIREDRRAERYAGLANATLRRVAADRAALLAEDGDTAPAWLMERWSAAWGADTAQAIAAAQAREPTLDITVREDAAGWAHRLGGLALGSATVRLESHAPIPELPGYAEGAWWVQDAAAAVPALLLAPAPGKTLIDLCAAPGGKTAQLLAAGATVTAVDRAQDRMNRLRENLDRLGLSATCVTGDAATLALEPCEGVLLDAPCSATGTIRRHPDVAWTKTVEDILKLASLQRRLLDHAATLVRPGGLLVYATCSLEPEEGERQIAAFLDRNPGFRRVPVQPQEVPDFAAAINAAGELRILPCHLPHPQPRMAGADGFFAARLMRVDATA